jgi:LysM repeat protein
VKKYLLLAAALLVATEAHAFTHVVQPGETLAQIAGRVYGDAKLEVVLVGANQLDAYGGTTIVPGMRLEVPSPAHHRVQKNETWYDLALSWLGDKKRSELLAKINGGVNWVPPVEGQEIVIPAVFNYIAGDNATINTIWDRYFDDPTRAWELNNYNNREGIPVKRGEVILVPLPHVKLTAEGKAEAKRALERERAEAGHAALDIQRKAESELQPLLADVRHGRYAEAVARGNRVLGSGVLTKPQLAIVHRALLEAYVALEATGSAINACAAWRENDPNPKLDETMVSPKIREACSVR